MAVKTNIMPKITKTKYMMTNAIMDIETTNNSLMGMLESLPKRMKARTFKIQTINSIMIQTIVLKEGEDHAEIKHLSTLLRIKEVI
jgi:hypothetical protein